MKKKVDIPFEKIVIATTISLLILIKLFI